jgi:hypothetical protein
LTVGEIVTVGLAVVRDGDIVTVAFRVRPMAWELAIPPSPVALQPTPKTRNMSRTTIKCFLTTIPIIPLEEIGK